MFTDTEVTIFRNFMVKTINPTICILGCLANIFNMIIFTRKHMRSSTNIYLTALAFADFFYLLFSLIELFNYYRFTHFHLAVYFYSYGTIVWLKEAFSYISISITVGFTIERYIAVRYPIHRQHYCTESIAKRIIIGLFIFCIVGTVTKPFEYQFNQKIKGYNAETNSYCDEVIQCYNEDYNMTVQKVHGEDTNSSVEYICKNNTEIYHEFDQFEYDNCKKIDYYKILETELRQNKTYMQIYSIVITIIFVLIPLIIIIVFNSLLIHIVREASKLRKKLTQVSVSRTESGVKKNSHEKMKAISQENKITIVLVSIVLVFLICQIPWAIYIIILYFTDLMEEQFGFFLAIILNTIVDINSAINLILYCGLSEEYRKTSKKILKEFTMHTTSSIKQKSMSTIADHTVYTSNSNHNNSNTSQ